MSRISNDQILAAYKLGLQVHNGDISRSDAKSTLELDYGVNAASASSLIGNLKQMLRGNKYKRAQSKMATVTCPQFEGHF